MRLTWLAAPLLFLTGCPAVDPPGSGTGPWPGWGPPDIGASLDFGGGGSPGPQPQFGATVTQSTPPPPLSGGTLLVLADDHTAIAADPDRDRIFIADTTNRSVKADLTLSPGDEPGRSVEDAAGRVHVVLRGGRAVVTLQPPATAIDSWTLGERRVICPAPRGIAFEAGGDRLHVVCAGGELVTLPAGGGAATRTLRLERDLRDVLVDNGSLVVSRFRSAQLLSIDANGVVTPRAALPVSVVPLVLQPIDRVFAPAVAWRMVRIPGAGIAVAHQRSLVGPVGGGNPGGGLQNGYGGGANSDPCSTPIVQSTVAVVGSSEPGLTLPLTVLPLDVAFSKDGKRVAILSAGNAFNIGLPQVLVNAWPLKRSSTSPGPCAEPEGMLGPPGEATAVAFLDGGPVVVQLREPAALHVVVGPSEAFTILLSTDSKRDTGHAVFHANAGGFIACASCHPEGGEDGHTWEFAGIGIRRTQSLRGGIRGSEPFHWDGDMKDFGHLVKEVFNSRMSGPALTPSQLDATLGWVDKIPRLPASAPADPSSVARGKVVFEDPNGAACTSCHNGPRLTNNVSLDVGTGGVFQVPSLVGVAWRAPFLHTGCAETLADRFGSCGGGDRHGAADRLAFPELVDLLAYLETL